MKSRLVPTLFAFALTASGLSASSPVSWNPPGLPPAPETGPALTRGAYLKPEQGQAMLEAALKQFPDRSSWEAYVQHARTRIQEGAGLMPFPKRTPLNPIVHSRREFNGYTVENVAFESVPGYFVTGNLYRPTRRNGPFAAILSTHGHSRRITKVEEYDAHARFSPTMQSRCATLARMGAVVLSIDMFGYGDSMQLVGQDAHKSSAAVTIQTWNSMRAVDFLLTLDGVDPKRIGVSGESGGGTQSFLLTALDPRIAISAPVVMVSSYFFGGCECESGLPIHRSSDHFMNNAMIAALAAPRPLLVVSDGKDWTAHVPQIEFPFLRTIYGYYGVPQNVTNVHLANEGHDYGPSKRAAFYRFASANLGLDAPPATGADGAPDESAITIEKAAQLRAFTAEHPIPHNALHDAAEIVRVLQSLQK